MITNNEELLKPGLCFVSSYLKAWGTRNELAKNTQTVKKIHAVTELFPKNFGKRL